MSRFCLAFDWLKEKLSVSPAKQSKTMCTAHWGHSRDSHPFYCAALHTLCWTFLLGSNTQNAKQNAKLITMMMNGSHRITQRIRKSTLSPLQKCTHHFTSSHGGCSMLTQSGGSAATNLRFYQDWKRLVDQKQFSLLGKELETEPMESHPSSTAYEITWWTNCCTLLCCVTL